jgi:hypothetical protein
MVNLRSAGIIQWGNKSYILLAFNPLLIYIYKKSTDEN